MTVAQQAIESPVTRCARHPKVETALGCGRCETPICPRCLVTTPVGARCPACARVKRIALLAKPIDMARGGSLGIAVAVVGSLVAATIPFLGIIGLAVVGFVTGEAVSVGANRKRAWELGALAIVCLLIGYLLSPYLAALLAGRRLDSMLFVRQALGTVFNPMLLLGLGVGALLAWMRAR